jgi:hypothetical protein
MKAPTLHTIFVTYATDQGWMGADGLMKAFALHTKRVCGSSQASSMINGSPRFLCGLRGVVIINRCTRSVCAGITTLCTIIVQ